MGTVKSHRDLVVWQRSMDLAVLTYELTQAMPKNEQYGLTSQMQRAAVSVSANIAEGNERGARKDYARFVSIARGSAVELETLFDLALRVKLLSQTAVAPAIVLADEVSRMLYALRERLRQEEGGFREPDVEIGP